MTMKSVFLLGLVSWLAPSLVVQAFLPPLSTVSLASDAVHAIANDSSGSFTRTTSPEKGTTTTTEKKAPIMLKVESHADWLELIEDYEDDDHSITVVAFTASWCKFCQKFLRKWNHKVVKPHRKKADVVKFASVDYGSNRQLCKSLDIDALPTLLFYHQGTVVHGLACGPKKLATAQETLARILQMSPEEMEQEAATFADSKRIEAANAKSSKNSCEEESEEPELYLRKRDRVKQKLKRKLTRKTSKKSLAS